MKIAALAILPLTLVACATSYISNENSSLKPEENKSLAAFQEICIKTAPSFAGAKEAASKFGINSIEDYGFTSSGFNEDKSLGVQIKPNNECVITTETQKDSNLTKKFLELVKINSKIKPSSRVPTKAPINGKLFIFHHDRNGGEAFVMLAPKG